MLLMPPLTFQCRRHSAVRFATGHSPSLTDDSKDLIFLDDDVFGIVNLHLGPRVLSDEDLVPNLYLHWDSFAGLVQASGADRNDLSLHWLLFGRVGNDDTSLHFFLS